MRRGRKPCELRPVFLGPGFAKHADGSCFVKFGDTHVICTATVEEKVPLFLRNTGAGWITAEYAMLPCAGQGRTDREAVKGKQGGRTHEIQRLIGRSLRAVTNLHTLGERQIKIDCDVIQADGGTRTASITGAYVALHLALNKLLKRGLLKVLPLQDQVAAVSCGIVATELLLDLDYQEDSTAEVDANFVITGQNHLVEVQATGEKNSFAKQDLDQLWTLAVKGATELIKLQQQILKL